MSSETSTDSGLLESLNLLSVDELEAQAKSILQLPNLTDVQSTSVQNWVESGGRLIRRRAELHTAGIRFHHSEALGISHSEAQHEIYYRTEAYFQGYYAFLSQTANLTHRFPKPFTGLPKTSNQKFLKGITHQRPLLADAIDILEIARDHRAFMDHPVSNQVAYWFTHGTNEAALVIVGYAGTYGPKRSIPRNAMKGGVMMDWTKWTPSYFDIEPAFKALLEYVIATIVKGYEDEGSAAT